MPRVVTLYLKQDNRYIAYTLLKRYFDNSFYVADLLSSYLNNSTLLTQDKKYINNLVLGTIRMKGKYDYILSDLYDGDYLKLKSGVKYILYIGLYQVDSMESTPDHAALSVCVDITKDKFPGLDRLVNAILRNYLRKKDKYKIIESEISSHQILSHPEWLIRRWIKNFGFNKTKEISNFNNSSQAVWFRINKDIDKKSVIQTLNSNNNNFKEHQINSSYFSINNPHELIQSKLFTNGKLSIQNPINGYIVDLLDPQNSDKIIDGCSAPGGKGSLIAHRAPDAKIYSIDNNSKRLEMVKETMERQSIKNIEILNMDISRERLPLSNKVLLDVPCSGTGVINRRIDIKWRRTQKELELVKDMQYRIIENASKYLKKDGILVYSTCSIEPEENELLIEEFLENHKFVVEDASDFVNKNIVQKGAIINLPGAFGMDGGYAIRLRKL